MDDRATHTLVVHRLTYAELWRLANRHWLSFFVLVHVKWLKLPKYDRTDTTSYAANLLKSDDRVPTILIDRLKSARVQYLELGFRYLGIDEEGLRANGVFAYFACGPVIVIQVISANMYFGACYSFPSGQLPLATANGRAVIDNSALCSAVLLPRRTRIAALVAHHQTRIASLALPDLTDADVMAHLEQMARNARAHQIARGVFIPQPLLPPLLPIKPA